MAFLFRRQMSLATDVTASQYNRNCPTTADDRRASVHVCGKMKNVYKVVMLGSPRVGKTTLIEEAIYGNRQRLTSPYEPTLEDIYCASVGVDNKSRDKIYLYDYSGVVKPINLDTIKMYLSFCDAFILVFAINDRESLSMVEQLKRNIDKLKEKKDIPIIILANKADRFNECVIDLNEVDKWATHEKSKLFRVAATDRHSINESLVYLTSKLSYVPSKSSFSRKTKSNSIASSLEL